jgi:hypothetical protein
VANCPDSEKWIHTGKHIALPPEAMDTKLRTIPQSLSLPTSPTKSPKTSGKEPLEGATQAVQEPPTESWSEQMETHDWVESQNNLASQASAFFSGRSSLTMRTPPPHSLTRKNGGSVGSVQKSPLPPPPLGREPSPYGRWPLF